MCIRDRYTDKDNDGNYTTAMPSTKLTYGTDRLDFAADSFIFGTSAKDSRYSKLLSTPYESSLIITCLLYTSFQPVQRSGHLFEDGI